jgi:hypothetical protein
VTYINNRALTGPGVNNMESEFNLKEQKEWSECHGDQSAAAMFRKVPINLFVIMY